MKQEKQHLTPKSVLKSLYGEDNVWQDTDQKKGVLGGLNTYAEQQAIEFSRWMTRNTQTGREKENSNEFIYYYLGVMKTIKQLYKVFLKEQKVNP